MSHNVLDTEVICTAWTFIRAQQFTGLYTSEEYRGEQQGEQHEVLVQVYVHARHFYGNRVAILYNIDIVHSIYCEMAAVSLAICKQFHPQESHLKVPSFVLALKMRFNAFEKLTAESRPFVMDFSNILHLLENGWENRFSRVKVQNCCSTNESHLLAKNWIHFKL